MIDEWPTQVDARTIVYCDESGNSGPNYVDPAQPFFSLGGWCVPYGQVANAAAEVEIHRQRYSLQSPELKASNLLRYEKGKQGAISLFRALGKHGCVPVYVVAEKRYCVAGKIVETFLDPAFNPLLQTPFIADTTTKQEIANTLYDRLPEQILNTFAAAYRRPSVELFTQVLDEVTAAVRSLVNDELADLMDGSKGAIAGIAEAEASASVFDKAEATLNLPALACELMMIEVMARDGFIEPVKFVHDETHAYQEGYKKLFVRMKDGKEGAFAYPNGALVLSPLKHIPTFEVVQSCKSPLVQAADILAGTITYLAKLAIDKSSITENDEELGSLVFPALLFDEPRVGWSIGSDKWVASLGRASLVKVGSADSNKSGQQRVVDIGPAPLLPAHRHAGTEDTTERFKFKVPVFGLVGEETGDLMHVQDEPPFDIPGGTAVLLFTDSGIASEFIEVWKRHGSLTEDMTVTEFGPGDIPRLVELLTRSLRVTNTMAVDCSAAGAAYVHLGNFVAGLERSLDRIRRAFGSGIVGRLFRKETVDGIEIASMLTAEGKYIAGRLPDGPFFVGLTREEAVQAAVEEDDSNRADRTQGT